MQNKARLLIAIFILYAAAAGAAPAAAQSPTGTIKGHVHLTGKLPGNPVIRMGRDPMCAKINAGKQIVQETVMASLDGSLANVFVKLEGTFPQTPVSAQPVTIDQRGCVYRPRVTGVKLGQTIQIKNSDNFLHNVHSLSAHNNNFNIGQAVAGLVYQFKPKDEEMLRIKCDVHSWMTAYIGIVNNPYFSVTSDAGTFQIDKAPVGTYKIVAWHELYGPVTKTVTVKAGAITTVDFTYTPPVKPAPARGTR